MNAVHELATRLKKAVKESGDAGWKPWVAVEVKRFLPDCFPEFLVVNFEVEAENQPKAAARRLDLAAWLAAWDGYALNIYFLAYSCIAFTCAGLDWQQQLLACCPSALRVCTAKWFLRLLCRAVALLT